MLNIYIFLQNNSTSGNSVWNYKYWIPISGPILGLHQANKRRRYFVTTSLIGWAQT